MARLTSPLTASLGLWPMRVAWLALPLVAGPGVRVVLEVRSSPVAAVAEIGLWVMWFAGLVALLAPSTVGLTVLRFVAPSIAAATLYGTIASTEWSAATVGAVAATSLVLVAAMLPQVGDPMINGSSYGPERRLALRPPAALLLGPIQLTWFVMFAAPAAGALLVAARRPLFGVPLLAVGLAACWRGAPSLHQLSRRWIVFVPAGFVIHDYWSLAESLLIRRSDIASLGPAPLDKGELLDLSGGALGLALLVETKDQVPLALRAKHGVDTFSAHRLVFTPSLPGQLLHEARVRGITIA